MPFNGAGVYTRLFSWASDKAASIKINASRMDSEFDGIATGLSNCITKDGQTTITANIPFNNRKATGLGDATSDTDALNRQTGDGRYLRLSKGSAQTVADPVSFSDVATFSKAANFARGASIASAGTPDIGAATGNFVHITGTTTITGFASATAGVTRILVFDGVLTLTHNATSLILPGGANITTAAGDVAEFVSEGSGNWRCVSYGRADGKAAAPHGWTLITSQSAANSATVDYTSGLDDTYDHYMIVFDAVKPSIDDSYLMMRVGTGAGPTWLATGYEYGGRVFGAGSSGDIGSIVDSITHSMVMTLTSTNNKVGNATGEHIRGVVEFSNPESSDYCLFDYRTAYVRASAAAASIVGFGQRGASVITGVRFMFNTGNIASGTFRLYGLRKS